MSAENDSHSHNFQTNIPNNISANKVESNIQILNNSASNSQAKKSEMSQEVIDQEDIDKFNISFFLPKELSKKIEGDDENLDNKNNILLITLIIIVNQNLLKIIIIGKIWI